MNITEVRPRLYLIGLERGIEKVGPFIASWVYDGEEKFLVDVGPRASVGELLEGLEALGIRKLDFIFLTHIHIDHAGGTGILVNHFPETKVICHEAGIEHLINPKRLWEGSKRVLGDLAIRYGEIVPVTRERILPPEKFTMKGLRVIKTPGHAAHHQSLVFKDYLFAGEAGGVYFDCGTEPYLRPATPPKFILEEAVGSIDKLLEVEAREICYAHFGIHRDAGEMLRRHRKQLYLWKDVIAEQMTYSGKDDLNDLVDRCIPVLLERDEMFRPFKEMDEEHKTREVYSIRNCIQGISEYVASRRHPRP